MFKKIYLPLIIAIATVIVAVIGVTKINFIRQNRIEKDLVINKETAKTIFLRDILKPKTLGVDVIALMYPRPLTSKDKLSPYLPDPLPESISQAPYLGEDAFFKITGPQWFFWVDQHPFARYAHPTQFVFLDGQTGSFEISEEMWWPMLNGEIVWDDNNYWSQKDWIYSNLENEEPKTSSNFNLGKVISNLPILGRPNLALADDSSQNKEKSCVLIVNGWKKGQTDEKDFEVDHERMRKIFKDRVHKRVRLTPKDEIGNALTSEIKKLAAECDDIIIYISSHGGKSRDGSHALILGNFTLRDTSFSLYLQSLAKDYPKVKFKIIIDACYSGGFINQLKKADNVVLVITSSGANEKSYGDRGDKHPTIKDLNPQDEGGEFSSGLTEDIEIAFANEKIKKELQEKAKSNNTSFDVELLKFGFKTAVEKDWGAMAGYTHPQIYEKLKTGEQTAPKQEAAPKQTLKKEEESGATPKTDSAPPTEPSSSTPAPNQKPIINTINVTQLHLNYEDTPHKYNLTAAATDPDNNLPLSYNWSIDCGFIFGSATANPIEWRYNIPGECINAKATVTVTDSLGFKNNLTQLLFP